MHCHMSFVINLIILKLSRVSSNLLMRYMGVKCYDKELLNLAAKKSGLCRELFETHDEKPTSIFLAKTTPP